jgi:hypothetical protein
MANYIVNKSLHYACVVLTVYRFRSYAGLTLISGASKYLKLINSLRAYWAGSSVYSDCISCEWTRVHIVVCLSNGYFSSWLYSPSGPGLSFCGGIMITLRHNTFGRTPLDEWSARSRNLYLTTQKIHNWKKSVPLAEFEPAIPKIERPQTHALGRASTGIGKWV